MDMTSRRNSSSTTSTRASSRSNSLVDQAECFWCQAPDCESQCPHCQLVYACSPEHLELHRPDDLCFPFRIRRSETAGRYMEATRDIQPLELILRDQPLLVGPSKKQSDIVCVECFKKTDASHRCPDCNFPLCNMRSCTDEAGSHRTKECPRLSQHGFRAAGEGPLDPEKEEHEEAISQLKIQTAALTPYRALLDNVHEGTLFRFHHSTQGQALSAMETRLLNVICDDFGYASRPAARLALRILANNAKSLELAGYENGTALYGRYSLLNHDCTPNTKCVVGRRQPSGYRLELRCVKPIARDEPMTTRYIGMNIGLLERQEVLREQWNFACSCARCRDPTDFGTYNSAILCQTCRGKKEEGYLLPRNAGESWECNRCGRTVLSLAIHRMTEIGKQCIRNNTSICTDSKILEEVLQDLYKTFHKNHYLVLQVKFVLISLLSGERNQGEMIGPKEWRRQVELCQEILPIVSHLDPGSSRNKGGLLKHLIPPFVHLAKHDQERGKISMAELEDRKAQSREYARELVSCFKHERI